MVPIVIHPDRFEAQSELHRAALQGNVMKCEQEQMTLSRVRLSLILVIRKKYVPSKIVSIEGEYPARRRRQRIR